MPGFAWEALWSVSALVLAVAIAFGAFRYLTRDRLNDPITEEATREEYDDPDYGKADEARLRRQLHH
jgi:hypothetical protein